MSKYYQHQLFKNNRKLYVTIANYHMQRLNKIGDKLIVSFKRKNHY